MPAFVSPSSSPRQPAQRGVGLIELMVTLTLGLLIVGAVVYVYLSSKGSYRTSKSTSRVQEAGRFGLDTVMADLRQAGFRGCASRMSPVTRTQIPVLQYAQPPLPVMAGGQVVARLNPASWSPTPALAANVVPLSTATDILEMQLATGNSVPMAAAPDPTVPAVYLANNCAQVATDAYLYLSNCTSATVVRVSNAPDTNPATACPANAGVVSGGVKFEYAASDAAGNAVNSFPNGNMALGGANAVSLNSHVEALVFDDVTYFVGQVQIPGATGVSTPRPPALYRLTASSGGVPEEVMDHVEDLCVMLGVPGPTGSIVYEAPPPSGSADWTKVASVQVSLYVTGDEQGAVQAGFQPALPWCGSLRTATDTRLHQVFTETAALRDQLP